MKHNIKKSEQLGEPLGTAYHRLRKEIIFHYVKLAGHNICHQCKKSIEYIDEFTIEHKTPWLDSVDPKKLFHDMKNIAFSHMKCNIKASRKKYCECGTTCKYNKGCRCEDCTRKNTEKVRKNRESQKRRAGIVQ